MVKLDPPGPVFYRQERIGLHKRPFKIIKFRTMVDGAESDGPALSHKNDTRITRIGAFLRKYRLDEIPQFWNVLKGEMSLVGPRPEREYFIDRIVGESAVLFVDSSGSPRCHLASVWSSMAMPQMSTR